MVGTFITPTFAQQFKEPDYLIRGGEVLGFEIDPETTSLVISLDVRARGELTITLPRNLIDAKIGSQDSDFIISVGLVNLISFDETKTKFDRTVSIPFKRGNHEITIMGTQVFASIEFLGNVMVNSPLALTSSETTRDVVFGSISKPKTSPPRMR